MVKRPTRLRFTEDDLTDSKVKKAVEKAEKAADKADKAVDRLPKRSRTESSAWKQEEIPAERQSSGSTKLQWKKLQKSRPEQNIL